MAKKQDPPAQFNMLGATTPAPAPRKPVPVGRPWLPGWVGESYRLPDGVVVLQAARSESEYDLSYEDGRLATVTRREFMRSLKKARLWTTGPWTPYEVPCLLCWQPVRIGYSAGERGPRVTCDRCEAKQPVAREPEKNVSDDITDEQLSVF